MRGGLVVLVWSLAAGATYAQDLNFIVATERGGDLAFVEPIIEREFGPITRQVYIKDYDQLDAPVPGAAHLIFAEGIDGATVPASFLFCDGRLSGVNAQITQQEFNRLFYDYDHRVNLGLDVKLMYSPGEMIVLLPTDDARVAFSGIGGKNTTLTLNYPASMWERGQYEDYCAERTYVE